MREIWLNGPEVPELTVRDMEKKIKSVFPYIDTDLIDNEDTMDMYVKICNFMGENPYEGFRPQRRGYYHDDAA